MRGVTQDAERDERADFISTRTPHAGSDHARHFFHADGAISTRTPHAGSDSACSSDRRPLGYFNPHSPCGE